MKRKKSQFACTVLHYASDTRMHIQKKRLSSKSPELQSRCVWTRRDLLSSWIVTAHALIWSCKCVLNTTSRRHFSNWPRWHPAPTPLFTIVFHRKGKTFTLEENFLLVKHPIIAAFLPISRDIYVRASDILQTDALFPGSALLPLPPVCSCGLIYLTISQEAFLRHKEDLVNTV